MNNRIKYLAAILPTALCALLLATSLASCKGRRANAPEPTGDTVEVMADCNRETPTDSMPDRSAGEVPPVTIIQENGQN